MGFVRGQRIRVIKSAPMLDPVEYAIMGYQVALRRSEADLIEVTPCSEGEPSSAATGPAPVPQAEVFTPEDCSCQVKRPDHLHEALRTIDVALVGNPNIGKTSLFN